MWQLRKVPHPQPVDSPQRIPPPPMLHERPRLRPYMFQASFRAGREEGLLLGLKTAKQVQEALYTEKIERKEFSHKCQITNLKQQHKEQIQSIKKEYLQQLRIIYSALFSAVLLVVAVSVLLW